MLLVLILFFSDYIRATQFFETVGFLAGLTSFIILLLGLCIPACQDRRILPILSSVIALGAGKCSSQSISMSVCLSVGLSVCPSVCPTTLEFHHHPFVKRQTEVRQI